MAASFQRSICSGYKPLRRQYSESACSFSAAVSITTAILSRPLQDSGFPGSAGTGSPRFWNCRRQADRVGSEIPVSRCTSATVRAWGGIIFSTTLALNASLYRGISSALSAPLRVKFKALYAFQTVPDSVEEGAVESTGFGARRVVGVDCWPL